MTRKLKGSVDYDRCTGVGACEQVCPEVFFMRDDGLPEVLEPEPTRLRRSSYAVFCLKKKNTRAQVEDEPELPEDEAEEDHLRPEDELHGRRGREEPERGNGRHEQPERHPP